MSGEDAVGPEPDPKVSRKGGILLALALAATVFMADQTSKLWVLSLDLGAGPLRLAPFADITLVWNRGISYGLLQQEGLGRWLLVLGMVVATVALAVWLARSDRLTVQLGLGAIIGGALGNLLDRLLYGAVVDFVHLHAGGVSWYVFNVADAAIVFGVAALLLDAALGRSAQSARRA